MSPVILRHFRTADIDDLAAGCDDPLTQRFLPHLPSPYTVADARWWVEEAAPAALERGDAAYALADPVSDRLIGGAGFTRVRQAVEIGYWVAPWARGRGVATAAARLLTDEIHAAGVHRVILRTELGNIASQRVAIAAGFTRESVERGSGRARDGSHHDLIVFSRLASDPAGPTRRHLPDLPDGRLTDGVVILRPVTPADADDWHALRTLPEVYGTSVPPVPPVREETERRCGRAESEWLAGVRAEVVILDAATGAFAGHLGLMYRDTFTQQAMIGYALRPEFRGRGFATRAAVLMSDWAFSIGIERVIAGTNTDNVASQRVLERAGFTREGLERSRLPGPSGGRVDGYLWARLPGDPPQS